MNEVKLSNDQYYELKKVRIEAIADVIAKVVVGVLVLAGVLGVLALCVAMRDTRPMYGYWRRYGWY
jgi:hypothetical protein